MTLTPALKRQLNLHDSFEDKRLETGFKYILSVPIVTDTQLIA